MTEWRVELIGEEIDLKVFYHAFKLGDPTIIVEQDQYFLKTEVFDNLGDGERIRNGAIELVARMNDSMFLFDSSLKSLSVGRIVKINDDGSRKHFVFTEGNVELRGDLSVTPHSVGSSPGNLEHLGNTIFQIAKNNQGVLDAIHFFKQNTWVSLYKAYEVVKDNPGGKEILLNYTPELKRFTQTAQSRQALGDDARHASNKFKPHNNPMSFDEAKSFIQAILINWASSMD